MISKVKCTDSNVKFADSEVRMASRFASSTQQEIEKLLEDKDSENTKRSTKVAKELFYEYLKEKNIQEPHDKKESLTIFMGTYYDSTLKTSIAAARGIYGHFVPWSDRSKQLSDRSIK